MPRTLEEPQRGERGWTGLSGGGQKGQPRAEVTGSQGLEARLAVTPEMGTLGGFAVAAARRTNCGAEAGGHQVGCCGHTGGQTMGRKQLGSSGRDRKRWVSGCFGWILEVGQPCGGTGYRVWV